MADTATRLLSGRAVGQVQPLEVHLVITDRALLGTGDADRSVFEPARVPGHGRVPAPVARARSDRARRRTDARRRVAARGCTPPRVGGTWSRWTRGGGCSPGCCGGCWCCATTCAPRRGVGRRSCTPTTPPPSATVATPRGATAPGCARGATRSRRPPAGGSAWSTPARQPARTGTANGRRSGGVPRKRRPAGTARPRRDRRDRRGREPRHRPREVEVTTPTGHRYRAQAPPLTGWGWQPTRPPRRARTASRLERHLIRPARRSRLTRDGAACAEAGSAGEVGRRSQCRFSRRVPASRVLG